MHDEEKAPPVTEGNQPEPLPSEGSILMDAPRKAPERFEMTHQLLEDLKIFRPADGQDPLEKWNEICDDLTANVTHINGRPDLFKLYDLVFHSVGSIKMYHEYTRGWMNALVIGDTATGKTQVGERLIRHYNAGTYALGGSHALWSLLYYRGRGRQGGQIQWRAIPEQDQGLVVVDLFHRSSERVRKMVLKASVDGFIESPGNPTYRADTRTRIILLACPVQGQLIYEITGIQAIKELLKKREFISSVDLIDVLEKDEVPLNVVNIRQSSRPKIEHRFTEPLCHSLLSWVWSRTPNQVIFPKPAYRETFRARDYLARKFPPTVIPLCDANLRAKVARMAAALAGRLFSTEDGENLMVTPAHVQAIVRFLDGLYAKPSFGWP